MFSVTIKNFSTQLSVKTVFGFKSINFQTTHNRECHTQYEFNKCCGWHPALIDNFLRSIFDWKKKKTFLKCH